MNQLKINKHKPYVYELNIELDQNEYHQLIDLMVFVLMMNMHVENPTKFVDLSFFPTTKAMNQEIQQYHQVNRVMKNFVIVDQKPYGNNQKRHLVHN